MGKSKKKKTGVNKHNPTGIQSVSEVEFELTSKGNTVPGALQEIIEKLQSPVDDARECGCTIVAGLVSEPGAIEQLIKHQVVNVLAPLVLDKCQEVRLKALGALRNLSVDGGPSVCEQMVQQDVMTSLVALSKLDGEDFPVEVKQAHHDVATEIYMQMVHLLLNLCEASSLAVSIFNKEKLWHFLSVPLLSQNTNYPISLRLAAAQCLYTVSEDNPELAATSLKDSIKQTIAAPATPLDASSELVLLRTLSMGILVNLVGSQVSADSGELVAMVTSLAEVLGIDVLAMLVQNNSEASELTKERMTEIQNLLSAQKVALEVVANLCCSDGDGWEDVSSSESSCDDVTDDVISDVTTEEPMEASSNGEMPCVPAELHATYVRCKIVDKVLNLAQPLTEEQSQSIEALSSGQKLANNFSSRQTHALLCLNNLFGSLGKEAFEDANKLDTVWQGLVTLSKDKKSIENQELIEAITSAMRALIQILTEAEPSKFSDISASDLQYMLEMALKCSWREVRVNSLRIVATIGTVLAKSLQPHPLLKDIGMFLLEVVCKDSDLWVVAEALDSIFDVFGEDHVDPVVREIGMVDKLKNIAPVLKSKVQSNKKTLGEHYPVISTARTNLVRFIKYKSK